ncbi:MAG: RNA ligase family protein [Candidatus Babeliales bacterium]|jgi:hypothetical protein
MTYFAYVTRIKNLRPIPKADNLVVGDVFGQEVVVGKDTREGQLGLYFPADGRLLPEYLQYNDLVRKVAEDGTKSGGIFAENGKVRVQKLRGQKSNGFFTALKTLEYAGNIDDLNEGEELNTFHGHPFCEKYVVKRNAYTGTNPAPETQKEKFLFFRKHHDTERILYKLDDIEKGMNLVITEKLHGTSQRSAHALMSQQTWWGALINRCCKRTLIKPTITWKYVCGTRNTVIKDWERHTGFYQEKEGFRKELHDKYFDGKLKPGETVYYEIVGYTLGSSLIMPSGKTEKIQDKELTKRYGKDMNFTYGCQEGQHEVYVYRMSITGEDGNEVDYTTEEMVTRCNQIGVNVVPILESFEFSGDIDRLVEICKGNANGCSTLDGHHIKEGVVIRNDCNQWQAWKYKSYEFDVLEDNIKLEGSSDMEEES